MRQLAAVAALVSEVQEDDKRERDKYEHSESYHETSNSKPGAPLAWSLVELAQRDDRQNNPSD